MSGKRQKRQLELAFPRQRRGEAPKFLAQGVELPMAENASESTATTMAMVDCITYRTAVVRTRMPGGVGGGRREAFPYPDVRRACPTTRR